MTKLEKRIYDLVPRLKEWKGGLMIKLDEKIRYISKEDDLLHLAEEEFDEDYFKYEDHGGLFHMEDDGKVDKSLMIEIIGHPIKFEDVLEALAEKNISIKHCDAHGDDEPIYVACSNYLELGSFRWQYGKDLSQQDDEVKKFLEDILLEKQPITIIHMSEKRIGTIENYYGGLYVKKEGNKFYWGIENYNPTNWEEIPETLYNKLVDFTE